MDIQIGSEASIATPPAGYRTLFINTDKGNQLYYKNSDGTFTPYTGDSAGTSGEIAAAWSECLCCALNNGMITADQYQSMMDAGYEVITERVTLDAVNGDYRTTVSVGSRNTRLIDISLDDQTVEMTFPAGTHQIVTTFNPTNTSNQNLTYITSDPAKATVSATGLITATGSGTVVITVIPEADPSKAKTVTTIIT